MWSASNWGTTDCDKKWDSEFFDLRAKNTKDIIPQ